MAKVCSTVLIRTLFICFCFSFSVDAEAQPSAPSGLAVNGYDAHIELEWFKNAESNINGYRIYRSDNGGDYDMIKSLTSIHDSYIDFIGEHDLTFDYKITAYNSDSQESDFSEIKSASTFAMTDEELMTMVQEYTFRYFWDFAHPVSGLSRERNSTSIVTTGGSGFGVMAILVGIKREFISYEDGVDRLLKIVNFLETADRFHGVYAHWMNGATGEVVPFSSFDNGGDLVETAFLIQGLLTVRQCIDGNMPDEVMLRDKITQIWEAVEWNWYRKQVEQVLYWHWSPEYLWEINHQVRGFNEAQIVYLLAIASPTHGVPASLYHNGWAGNNYVNGNSYYDYPLEVGSANGGPLFFSHYSYMGFDPRFKKDAYANYFNRNVNHTLINRAYCIENPKNYEGYGENCWGLTASDNPFGYLAHEPTSARDNGTITPTAALSSMPYTPTLSMQALKHFYREHGEILWGEYGFYDAFNLEENWFATSYLAIDQGPIIGMIENYRSQLLWDCFMANPEIEGAMDAIGFEVDSTLISNIEKTEKENIEFDIFPNPSSGQLNLHLNLLKKNNVSIELIDISGKGMKTLVQNVFFQAGVHVLTIEVPELCAGIYLIKIQTERGINTRKILIDK